MRLRFRRGGLDPLLRGCALSGLISQALTEDAAKGHGGEQEVSEARGHDDAGMKMLANAAHLVEPHEWLGVLPLGCDEHPEWREVRQMMIATPRTEPDDCPCSVMDDDASELLPKLVSSVFDFNTGEWFGSGMFCATCELLDTRPEDVMCTMGLVSGFACITRMCAYTRKHLPDEWALWNVQAADSSQGTTAKPLCDLAYEGLTNMLFSATNFLELLPDSGWPWRLSSIWQVVGEWEDLSWRSDAEVAGLVEKELWRLRQRNSVLLSSWLHVFRAGAALLDGQKELKVFALGMHTGLLREPLLALQEVLPDVPFGIVAPCGGDKLCGRTPGVLCNKRDEMFHQLVLEHMYKKPLNSYQNFHSDSVQGLHVMRSKFIAYFREQIISADVLICSEPLAFCSFYDGSDVPVVAYLGNGPLFYVSDLFEQGFVDESLTRMGQRPHSTFIAMNYVLASMADRRTSTKFHTFTPISRHLGSSMYSYAPADTRGGELLISKRVIASWDIRCVMQMLLIRAQVWLARSLAMEQEGVIAGLGGVVSVPKVYQVGELPPHLQSIEAWSTFRACLMLPWDASGLHTYDIYALGIPIFVPDPIKFLPSFVYRSASGSSVGKPPRPGPPLQSFGGNWHNTNFANDSFLSAVTPSTGSPSAGRGWDTWRIGSMMTDFYTLPHLIHVTALSDIIARFLDTEGLRVTSTAMAEHHREMHAESRNLWASVLAKALKSTAGASAG